MFEVSDFGQSTPMNNNFFIAQPMLTMPANRLLFLL